MASVFSMLAIILVGAFWLLRIVVAITAQMQIEFFIEPLNLNIEIALLFITLLALILIIKRKMIGALIYLIAYAAYFGVDVFTTLNNTGEEAIGSSEYGRVFISGVAMLIALFVFIDMSFSKDVSKKGTGSSKKTNWFYGTDEYTRVKDERDDTNQYKM